MFVEYSTVALQMWKDMCAVYQSANIPLAM